MQGAPGYSGCPMACPEPVEGSRVFCETWGFSSYVRELFSNGSVNEKTDPLPN
jgi:hypothetical protein